MMSQPSFGLDAVFSMAAVDDSRAPEPNIDEVTSLRTELQKKDEHIRVAAKLGRQQLVVLPQQQPRHRRVGRRRVAPLLVLLAASCGVKWRGLRPGSDSPATSQADQSSQAAWPPRRRGEP